MRAFILAVVLTAVLAATGNLGAQAAQDSSLSASPQSKTNYTEVLYEQTG